MHEHRKFFKAKFGALADEITKLESSGIFFSTCPSCGFRSFREDPGNVPLLEYECMVCNVQVTGLLLDCPKCGEQNKLVGEPWHKCKKCNHQFDENDIQVFFTKYSLIDKDDFKRTELAHCCECDGYETVGEINGIWFCSQCFTKYNSEEVKECDWCNSLSTGNLDESYYRGCVACEGHTGWENDKDD